MNTDELKKADEIVRALLCQDEYADDDYAWNEDLHHDAAALIESLQAQLAESQRREKAAVEDMKAMALVMRESDDLSEGCCFACAYEAQNLPDNVILAYGECPGYETDDCFKWRGPQTGKGENNAQIHRC